MHFKRGVSPKGLKPQMIDALNIARRVYRQNGASLTVTSTTDGRHKKDSLHYVGLAVDLRIRDIGDTRLEAIYFDLAAALTAISKCFQVILESDHIHVEYDRSVCNETSQNESRQEPQNLS